MNTLMCRYIRHQGFRYKLLEDASCNHSMKYTMRVSESQQSETSSNLLKYEIQKQWFRDLRLIDLFNWVSSLKTWIKKDIKECRLFKLTEKVTGFKSYHFDEAVRRPSTFHVIHSQSSLLNAFGQNNRIGSHSLRVVINSDKKFSRNIILTILIVHTTIFQKKIISYFKENIGPIFGICKI